jgi:hypothetical protein
MTPIPFDQRKATWLRVPRLSALNMTVPVRLVWWDIRNINGTTPEALAPSQCQPSSAGQRCGHRPSERREPLAYAQGRLAQQTRRRGFVREQSA